MQARSLATGSLTFGLVTIPVRMFSATQPQSSVSFNLLHDECKSRLKQQYVCPRCDKQVSREHMVKGYEFTKEQYVTFTNDELKALEERSTGAIDITEFVPLAQVDPVYFDKPYFLAPDRGGEKAYHLLAEVMRESGRTALGRYAARGKQYLVLIRPMDRGLVMQQLLYADEVRPFSDVPMPDVPVIREPERKLAHQLIEQISAETFEPGKYEDDVKKRILADIQKKVDGQDVTAPPEESAPAQIIDLMEALKRSLEASAGGRSASTPSAARDDGAAETEVRRPARAADSTKQAAEKVAPRRPATRRPATRRG
jgi:DNA end-binding protein Ku